MYENQFSQNNRDALDALMYSVNAVKSVNINKLSDVIDTSLCSDPEWVHKTNEYFNSAEHWLNYHGIETRTEYGNLLPTYNLFLKIGEWLERRKVEERDE